MICISYPILKRRRNESNELVVVGSDSTDSAFNNTEWERKTHVIMAITENPQITNDLADLINERVDNLAALITVTAEQLDDRTRAGDALDAGAHRTAELVELVFGGATPSVENYLASQHELQAA